MFLVWGWKLAKEYVGLKAADTAATTTATPTTWKDWMLVNEDLLLALAFVVLGVMVSLRYLLKTHREKRQREQQQQQQQQQVVLEEQQAEQPQPEEAENNLRHRNANVAPEQQQE